MELGQEMGFVWANLQAWEMGRAYSGYDKERRKETNDYRFPIMCQCLCQALYSK